MTSHPDTDISDELHNRINDARVELERRERELSDLVLEARSTGATWSSLGRALGLTRQGAQQRYGV